MKGRVNLKTGKIPVASLLSYFEKLKAGPIARQKDWLVIGENVYTTVLKVKSWPDGAFTGFMRKYIDQVASENTDIHIRLTYRFMPTELEFNQSMDWKRKRLQASINAAQKNNEKPRSSEVKAVKTISYLEDKKNYDTAGDLVTLDLWCYVSLVSSDLEKLKKVTKRICDRFGGSGIKINQLPYEQTTGLLQSWILGHPDIPYKDFYYKNKGRLVDDTAAATIYPASFGDMSDGSGVYFGHRIINGYIGPPTYRRHGQSTGDGNITIVGATGQGKSVILKSLATGFLLEGHRVFVFDVDGEWEKWVKAMGGVWVNQSGTSGRYMDPLWVPPPLGKEDYDCERLNNCATSLLSIVSLLVEGPDKKYDVEPAEMNAAEKALMRLWKKKGIIREDPSTWRVQRVRIMEWYRELKEDESPEAVSLANKIWGYFEGLRANIFNQEDDPETLDNAKAIVIHVSQSIDNEVDAHTGAVKMQLAQNTIWHQVVKEKLRRETYTNVVYDEGQRVVTNTQSSINVNKLSTGIRKYNGNLLFATNKPASLFATGKDSDVQSGGIGLWSNSSYKILLWMETSDLNAVKKHADIPEHIISTVSQLKNTHQFILRGDIRQKQTYDILKMCIPEIEEELYKTRGLR